MTPFKPTQGIHGAGKRSYEPEQYRAVVDLIRALGEGETLTVADVSRRTGVGGRTVREIVSAADGRAFLLGGDGNSGYRLAGSSEDAAQLTRRYTSQAQRMTERLLRRWQMGLRMYGLETEEGRVP